MTEEISGECKTKKPNWVTDCTLPKSEKFFHFSVLIAGWIVFFFAIGFLIVLVWSTAQGTAPGPATVALSIVSFLLLLFSLFCISGRGVQVIADLMGFSKKTNYIKTLGFEMHRSDDIANRIMEQEDAKKK